jgi:predicted secreted protein
MSGLTYAALFFIIWWTVLFMALPFGLKTQDDSNDVTLGTVASAPRGPHVRRAMILTTIIALVVLGSIYLIVDVADLGISDIPRMVPDYK